MEHIVISNIFKTLSHLMGPEHLKESKEFYKDLFSRIPREDLLKIQKLIIDSTRGDHWNDLSHNTQNIITEWFDDGVK